MKFTLLGRGLVLLYWSLCSSGFDGAGGTGARSLLNARGTRGVINGLDRACPLGAADASG